MRLTVVQQIETCIQVRNFCGCAKHNYQIFRVYGLKRRFMYSGALKLVSIFQQGKPSSFCESVLSDLQSSSCLRKVNHCVLGCKLSITVTPILPQLQPTQRDRAGQRSWVTHCVMQLQWLQCWRSEGLLHAELCCSHCSCCFTNLGGCELLI